MKQSWFSHAVLVQGAAVAYVAADTEAIQAGYEAVSERSTSDTRALHTAFTRN